MKELQILPGDCSDRETWTQSMWKPRSHSVHRSRSVYTFTVHRKYRVFVFKFLSKLIYNYHFSCCSCGLQGNFQLNKSANKCITKLHILPYGTLTQLFTYLLTDSNDTATWVCLLFVMIQQNATFSMWAWPQHFKRPIWDIGDALCPSSCQLVKSWQRKPWPNKKHSVNLVPQPYSIRENNY